MHSFVSTFYSEQRAARQGSTSYVLPLPEAELSRVFGVKNVKRVVKIRALLLALSLPRTFHHCKNMFSIHIRNFNREREIERD